MRFFLLVLTLVCVPALAVSERTLNEQMSSTIEPFYRSGHGGTFLGEKGVSLAYRFFLNPKPLGTVVVATGYSENIHKYAEVAFDLYRMGYSVFLYDHRGQGFSERLLPDKRKAHIDEFDFMVRDLHTYLHDVVAVNAPAPYYLLAHSMGGLVGARFLEAYPDEFSAAVLSAPMMTIDLHGLMETPVRLLLNLFSNLGVDTFFVNGPANPQLDTFAQNRVTHSEMRFNVLNRDLAQVEPQALVWGMTARWLDQSLKSDRENLILAGQVKTPVLMFMADEDSYTMPAGQNEFCQRAANCKLKLFTNSNHEILMERDVVRDAAMDAIGRDFQAAPPGA